MPPLADRRAPSCFPVEPCDVHRPRPPRPPVEATPFAGSGPPEDRALYSVRHPWPAPPQPSDCVSKPRRDSSLLRLPAGEAWQLPSVTQARLHPSHLACRETKNRDLERAQILTPRSAASER